MHAVYIAIGAALLTGVALIAYAARTQRSTDTSNSFLTDVIATFSGGKMQTSISGKNAIMKREGVVYKVYLDAINLKTAGIGHLLTGSDKDLPTGTPVSVSQVQAWFDADVAHAENIVKRYVSVPLTQGQFDALVSVVFNTGSHFFRNKDGSQTRVSKYLDAGNFPAASAEFPRWVFGANGQQLAGLVTRRAGERAQFDGGTAYA